MLITVDVMDPIWQPYSGVSHPEDSPVVRIVPIVIKVSKYLNKVSSNRHKHKSSFSYCIVA